MSLLTRLSFKRNLRRLKTPTSCASMCQISHPCPAARNPWYHGDVTYPPPGIPGTMGILRTPLQAGWIAMMLPLLPTRLSGREQASAEVSKIDQANPGLVCVASVQRRTDANRSCLAVAFGNLEERASKLLEGAKLLRGNSLASSCRALEGEDAGGGVGSRRL